MLVYILTFYIYAQSLYYIHYTRKQPIFSTTLSLTPRQRERECEEMEGTQDRRDVSELVGCVKQGKDSDGVIYNPANISLCFCRFFPAAERRKHQVAGWWRSE